MLIADVVPADRRQLKLELLDRASLKPEQRRKWGRDFSTSRQWRTSGATLGETEKARKLIVETLPVAIQYTEKTDIRRGFFAASLARFDLTAALAIANEFSVRRDKDRVLGLMARSWPTPTPPRPKGSGTR